MTGARRGGAVLGSPIGHSLSPVLHRAAYEQLGYSDWTYEAVECTETELPATLQSSESRGLAGVSLTMPLKRAAMPLLTRTDRVAADVGAANTVLFGGVEGDWYGANTDVPGIVAALRRGGVTSVAAAIVLGGGATAASAFAALAPMGAAVTVYARRPEAAAPGLGEVAARIGVPAPEVVAFDLAAPRLGEAELVISTTPAGGTDSLVVDLPGQLPGALFDVVYAPWPTVLAAAWSARGGVVIGGLDLLVEQAALQVELMTGHLPDVDVMRTAGTLALSG